MFKYLSWSSILLHNVPLLYSTTIFIANERFQNARVSANINQCWHYCNANWRVYQTHSYMLYTCFNPLSVHFARHNWFLHFSRIHSMELFKIDLIFPIYWIIPRIIQLLPRFLLYFLEKKALIPIGIHSDLYRDSCPIISDLQ